MRLRRSDTCAVDRVFLRGVIEGFYGRVWPWQERHAWIDFLAANAFNTYVYAPKADRSLRRAWREDMPPDDLEHLRVLREHCRQKNVGFGIGFSPWGLQSEYTAPDRAALKRKFAQINQLNADFICILFDDMPGDFERLAARQIDIVYDIAAQSNADRFAMCPTYYSFDPVLEQLFGKMPENYLEDLGRRLDTAIDIFWTGSQVLAPGFTREDIDAISSRIRRKPLLWDNYPVNDGRKSSRFLHVKPVVNRPARLHEWCAGHFANPMNQPRLSRFPLMSLATSYASGDDYCADSEWARQVRELTDRRFAALLERDANLFQTLGLDALSNVQRQQMISEYSAVSDPSAQEIVDWLEERYRFDPECLND